MKLLIVDDHAGVRKLIRELMGHRTTEIRECSDGQEAIRICGEFAPDFVINSMCAPLLAPCEASYMAVLTRSSCKLSGAGVGNPWPVEL